MAHSDRALGSAWTLVCLPPLQLLWVQVQMLPSFPAVRGKVCRKLRMVVGYPWVLPSIMLAAVLLVRDSWGRHKNNNEINIKTYCLLGCSQNLHRMFGCSYNGGINIGKREESIYFLKRWWYSHFKLMSVYIYFMVWGNNILLNDWWKDNSCLICQ